MEQTDKHSLLLVFFLFALSALAFVTVVLQSRRLASLAAASSQPVVSDCLQVSPRTVASSSSRATKKPPLSSRRSTPDALPR